MANILIAGDSWGIGTYTLDSNGVSWSPTGNGIQSILEQSGHTVTNISKGGGSNWLMIDRMEGQWWDTGRCLFGHSHADEIKEIKWPIIDYIVFLQTDIFRERYCYVTEPGLGTELTWKKLEDEFVNSLLEYDTLSDMIDQYFNKFYSKLNSIAVYHNKPVLMLGCWSQLHPSISSYSNLVTVVDSATKLLIPELEHDVYLSDHEWYVDLSNNHAFMQKFGNEFKQMTITVNRKLELIYNTWRDVHPTVDGYQQLAKQILKHFG